MRAPSQRQRRIRIYAYSDADQGQTGIVTPLYIFQQEVWAEIRPESGDERTSAAQAQRVRKVVFLLADTVSVPLNGLILVKATGEAYRVEAVLPRWEGGLQQVKGLFADDGSYQRNDSTVFINATVGMAGSGELASATTENVGVGFAELSSSGELASVGVETISASASLRSGGGENAAAGVGGIAAFGLAGAGSEFSFAQETIPGTAQEAGGGTEASAAGILGIAAVGLEGMGSENAGATETISGSGGLASGGSINASQGIPKYPNKPAGLSLITERPYTSNPDGWPTAARSGSVSNVSDATAPYSPPGCEDFIYPAGLASGDSIVEQKFTFSSGVRKLYIAIVFEMSSNFVGDNSFVNKIGFVEPGNIGSIIVNANGAGNVSQYQPEIRTQANAGTDRNMGPNVAGNTGYTFPRGSWVIWEMYFVLNSTPTTADGTCDCWIQALGQDANPVHTHHLTGQMWDNAGNLFTAYDEEKIWGGNSGTTLAAQQSIRMDHIGIFGA